MQRQAASEAGFILWTIEELFDTTRWREHPREDASPGSGDDGKRHPEAIL